MYTFSNKVKKYLLIIIMKITTSIVNNVIVGPHGITDLLHAYHNNNMNSLVNIYIGTTGMTFLSELIHHDYNNIDISNGIFVISSILHFRHDIPEIRLGTIKIPSLVLSSLFIIFTPLTGKELFYVYMCLIHVPIHYMKCIDFIKKDIVKFLGLLFMTSFFEFGIMGDCEIDCLPHNMWIIVKTLIIAHVIYNELYLDIKKS